MQAGFTSYIHHHLHFPVYNCLQSENNHTVIRPQRQLFVQLRLEDDHTDPFAFVLCEGTGVLFSGWTSSSAWYWGVDAP